MKTLLILFFCLLSLFNCLSIEEKRGIFADNILNYIQKELTIPKETENLVGKVKSDITILLQGTKLSEIPILQRKYDLTNEMANQIKTAQFLSNSNIYSKLEERINIGTGVIKNSIGAAFRDGDMVYFAMIRPFSSATLRIKYERVCHEECDKFLIFFEDCDTVCNYLQIPYTQAEIKSINQYTEYYSTQALLEYANIFRKRGYQIYLTDGNGIYSEDGNYVAYITDFGDITIGPSSDISVVQKVFQLEVIDEGVRDYRRRVGREGRGDTRNPKRTFNHGSFGSVSRSGLSWLLINSFSGTRNTGITYSGRGNIINRDISRNNLLIKSQCYEEEITVQRGNRFGGRMLSTTNICFSYYDGNFQKFNYIGKNVNGSLTKEEALRRMYDGRKKGEYHMIIFNDGNLVVYSGEEIIWQANTANQGVGPYNIKVTNDRYLILEDSTGKVLYKSGTIEIYNLMKRIYCTPVSLAFEWNSYHDATIGILSSSYCKEEVKWKTLTKYEENTREIFDCYINTDNSISTYYMVSLDPNCEGQRKKGSLGYIYSTQIQGTQPIYRCRIENDHFISPNSDCEGNIREAILGFAFPA